MGVEFFHLYGSGFFSPFDNEGNILDSVKSLNVFESPILKHQLLCGPGFVETAMNVQSYSVRFFPEAADGLFPILRNDEGIYLLLDPKDEGRAFLADDRLSYFKELRYGALEFLYRAFKGEKDVKYWGIPVGNWMKEVRFVLNWKDAFAFSGKRTGNGPEKGRKNKVNRRRAGKEDMP